MDQTHDHEHDHDDIEEGDPEIMEKFSTRRKIQFFLITPLVIAGIVLLVVLDKNPDFQLLDIPREILTYLSVAALVLGVIFSLFNWRCPGCRYYLRRNVNPHFCPKCGVQLSN